MRIKKVVPSCVSNIVLLSLSYIIQHCAMLICVIWLLFIVKYWHIHIWYVKHIHIKRYSGIWVGINNPTKPIWNPLHMISLHTYCLNSSDIPFHMISKLLKNEWLKFTWYTIPYDQQVLNNEWAITHGVYTLRPRQNGRHFPDDIFKCIFLNENVRISIKISLKFVPKDQINNIPSFVQIMIWRRPGDKP